MFLLSIFNAECGPFMHALVYPAFHNCRAICRASRVSAPPRFGITSDLNNSGAGARVSRARKFGDGLEHFSFFLSPSWGFTFLFFLRSI
jgi:hypothetical protein